MIPEQTLEGNEISHVDMRRKIPGIGKIEDENPGSGASLVLIRQTKDGVSRE